MKLIHFYQQTPSLRTQKASWPFRSFESLLNFQIQIPLLVITWLTLLHTCLQLKPLHPLWNIHVSYSISCKKYTTCQTQLNPSSFRSSYIVVSLCRKQLSVDVRWPITLDLLHSIIQVDRYSEVQASQATFTSASLFAYLGFLWVGELTIHSMPFKPEFYNLVLSHLQITPYSYSSKNMGE